jgi:hypothetical protein
MIRAFIGIGLILLLSTCSAPAKKQQWYKGNLHTHTYWSDGDEFPEMVLNWYKTNGYDFIGLSDHNTLSRDEKWVLVQKSPLYETGFQKYLDRFGKDWVEFKTDTGRIQVKLKTYTEYQTKIQGDNFLIIPSEEITCRVDQKHVHINATNIQEFIAPPRGTTVAETMQLAVNEVLEQRKRTGTPMFPHINHPNFFYSVSLEDMISLTGERFFEVYNGHPMVNNYGDSLHLSTEAMWDRINIAYANRNQPLMFGLATDDSHNYHQFGSAFSNAGRGWVMVQADALKADNLIAAMEAGNFYATTGVRLSTYEFSGNEIKIEIEKEKGIEYKIEFIGAEKGEKETQVLRSVNGSEGNFIVADLHQFVRARITSTKPKPNPFQDGDFEMAWTQPVSKQ